jgi:hypothetical protein
MKARNRVASSSTSRSTTRTPLRRIDAAARWVDGVGLAALLPVSDVVLPSLWEAVAGTRDVEWAVEREDGKQEFTPEMSRCWAWKDELAERKLVCVGKHLGRWQALVAPRLVPALWTAAAERREALGSLEREVAAAVSEAGPSTSPQLREALGAEKKSVDKAVVTLQRAMVVTNAQLVEQQQGWGAIAVDLVSSRYRVREVPEAARELVRAVLASSGEVSAADVGGALGLRLKPTRTLLDELVDAGEASRRDEDGLALYRSS